MNNINLTTFVQEVIDTYVAEFTKNQKNMSDDKISNWESYKKTAGVIKGISYCHDILIAAYNKVTNNNTVITKENVDRDPNNIQSTMSVVEPFVESPVEGQ